MIIIFFADVSLITVKYWFLATSSTIGFFVSVCKRCISVHRRIKALFMGMSVQKTSCLSERKTGSLETFRL